MNALTRISRDHWILIGATIIFALVSQFVSPFQLNILTTMLYWAYLGTAWNIMGGYAGQFSFGHAAFFGIGAYTSTVMYIDFGISPWIGMVAGMVLAALFGAFTGWLTFRFGVKGHFFALATFAFAEMLRLIAQDSDFVNASIGLQFPIIGGDSWALMFFEETAINYYYLILGMLVVCTLVSIWIYQNKIGFYLQAIREDEDAAAALGVDALNYKIIAVAISAALTAAGGTFFAQRFGFIDPMLVFGVAVSIDILLRPIFGGSGTVWGPLVGALLLTPLEVFTRALKDSPPAFLSFIEGRSGTDVMLFGIIVIVVVIFMPDGVVGTATNWLDRLRNRETPPSPNTPQEASA
ncbi:MAG: branched-chain amino acid ABC transporter permease [Chloroflexota bacterium]